MFQATIISKQKNQYGSFDVTVSFTDGVNTNQDVIKDIVDDEGLKEAIQDRISFYTKASSFDPKTGAVDLTPVVPEAPTPTQDEIDRQTFGTNIQTLRQILAAMKVGVLPEGSDADIVSTLQKTYRIEYLNLFSL